MDGTENRRATPHEEAAEILRVVIQELSNSEGSLKSALRQCQHACQLLGWPEAKAWIQNELAGYPPTAQLPPYRLVNAKLVWQIQSLPKLLQTFDRATRSNGGPPEATSYELRGSFDVMLQSKKVGIIEATGEAKQLPPQEGKAPVSLERVIAVEAPIVAQSITDLENAVFEFASSQYALLRYGNALSSIWTDYRHSVDIALGSLGFEKHLEAVESGIASDNPVRWRDSMLASRSLLNDIANYLWQDQRKEYVHLAIDVSQGKFANRLAAYAHQKGLRGTSGKFFRDEVERLAVSIRSLISYQSEAHEPVSKMDAQSVALATYFLIGELVTKTDMRPVEKYEQPASGLNRVDEVASPS